MSRRKPGDRGHPAAAGRTPRHQPRRDGAQWDKPLGIRPHAHVPRIQETSPSMNWEEVHGSGQGIECAVGSRICSRTLGARTLQEVVRWSAYAKGSEPVSHGAERAVATYDSKIPRSPWNREIASGLYNARGTVSQTMMGVNEQGAGAAERRMALGLSNGDLADSPGNSSQAFRASCPSAHM